MYIEEVSEKGEISVEEEEVGDGDKTVLVSSGDVVVLTTKMALVGVGARALFYPTLIYNVVRNKVEAEFHWWDRVAQFILLGAVPFPSDVPRLKELGVCGVITLNEPYETLVPSSLYKSYCIDHLVIATRDYCYAPSMEAICQAVDFIHRNASLGKTTYVHCKAGRGRSTTIVLCYLVQHKDMTPEEAYAYVRSVRPRVKLASTQWKAVLEYYNVRVLNTTQSSLTDATSALIPRSTKQVCSGNVVVFDDGSVVVGSQEKSREWFSHLVPSKEESLVEECKKASTLKVFFCSDTLFEVHDGSVQLVDMSNQTCSCFGWKPTGLPCQHAIAVLNTKGRNVYEYCSSFFTVESFRSTYSEALGPVAIDLPSVENEGSSKEEEEQVLPPLFSRVQGVDKRIKDRKRGRSVCCTKCGGVGHNKATCKDD